MMHRRVAPLAWACSLVALVVGCAESEPAPLGAVILAVDTNLTPGRDFSRVEVVVRERAGATPTAKKVFRYAWSAASERATVIDSEALFPLTLSVSNARPGLEERFVEVSAWATAAAGDVPVFHRAVSFVVPRTGTRTLRVPIEWLCTGRRADGAPWVSVAADGSATTTCAKDSCVGGRCTCVAGACVPVHVSVDDLPPAEDSALGRGAPLACSDPLACFGARAASRAGFAWTAYPVRVNGTCGLQWFGLRARRLSVALLAPPGSRGRCTADGCIVPLNLGATPRDAMSWSESLGVAFPEAVCELGLPVLVRDLDAYPEAACLPDAEAPTYCAEWTRTATTEPGNASSMALATESTFGGEPVCAPLTRTSKLCESRQLTCGSYAIDDPGCNEMRMVRCGTCTGGTEGMASFAGGEFVTGLLPGDTPPAVSPDTITTGTRRTTIAPFFLDKYEVSVGDFIAYCNNAQIPCKLPGLGFANYCNFLRDGSDAIVRPLAPLPPFTRRDGGRVEDTARLPANCVSLEDAARYCNARGKRLPTEDEFEFAARNGAKRTPYPWGTDGALIPPISVQTRCDDVAKRLPLSDRDVSEAGVVALSTGVSEWTASPWTESLDRTSAPIPAKVAVRGGWDCRPSNSSLQRRDGGEASLTPTSEIGFRCAR